MSRVIKFRAWDGREMFTPLHLSVKLNKYGELKPVLDTIHLMQFTGLLDKNGKEIYEGDILSDRQSPPTVVKWDENGAGFIGFNELVSKFDEIIGNIYENPELLAS